MGLQDRDYMHERERTDSPFSPPPSTARSSWSVILIIAVCAFVLFKGYEWLLERREKPPAKQQLRPGPVVVVPPVVSNPSTPARPARQWVRCEINGQTLYSDSDCPDNTLTGRSAASKEPQSMVNAPAQMTTLYHCKAYNGGTFWASSHCNQHKALVDRMVNVPSSLPFARQVQMAEANQHAAASLARSQLTVSHGAVATSNKAQCKELNAQIAHWDSMARQPQSGATQDWIRDQRKQVRDQQFALRC